MKKKQNARQKRETEARRRKDAFFSPGAMLPDKSAATETTARKSAFPMPSPRQTEAIPQKTPEEETREFLDYLERHSVPSDKEDMPQRAKRKPGSSGTLPRLNLEEGMPLVEEALGRMRTGLQEFRVSRAKAVKLIHGYGSTGRGGKIRDSVRDELSAMQRRKLIRNWIPGEDFGPTDPASRKLAEQNNAVTHDPDYGRMNHGISIVVL